MSGASTLASSAGAAPQRAIATAFSDAPIGAFKPTAAQTAIIEFSRRAGLGNGFLRKHGAAALLKLRDQPIDYDYFGLRLRFYPALCGSMRHMLMSPNWSEREERAFILARTPDDGVFVDVGVNVGFFLFHVAAHRPNATIVGFEPAPAYHALDSFNIAANQLANVHLFQAALSDQAGAAHFNLDGESLAHGSGAIEVKTLPLLDALAERKIARIDCLKIDIEGAEDKALMPFFRSADRALWPKAVVIEDGRAHWREDILSFMLANGYREEWRSRLNLALTLAPS